MKNTAGGKRCHNSWLWIKRIPTKQEHRHLASHSLGFIIHNECHKERIRNKSGIPLQLFHFKNIAKTYPRCHSSWHCLFYKVMQEMKKQKHWRFPHNKSCKTWNFRMLQIWILRKFLFSELRLKLIGTTQNWTFQIEKFNSIVISKLYMLTMIGI